MFVWWVVGSIGWFCIGIIYCQDHAPVLTDLEPRQDDEARATLSAVNNPSQTVTNDTNNLAENDGIVTTTIAMINQTPEPFSCHQCRHCNSESDFITTICETGITMCYTMYKRIDNTSQIILRGCSTSKGQCTVPNDDQSNSIDSITCCNGHKCNEATQFKPFFFLSTLSLFTILISLLNT